MPTYEKFLGTENNIIKFCSFKTLPKILDIQCGKTIITYGIFSAKVTTYFSCS